MMGWKTAYQMIWLPSPSSPFIHLPSLVTPNSPRGVPLEIIQPFELADFGNLQTLQAGKRVITSTNHGPWLANVIYKFNNRI